MDAAAAAGTVDPGSWMSIANYTGVSEAGSHSSSLPTSSPRSSHARPMGA